MMRGDPFVPRFQSSRASAVEFDRLNLRTTRPVPETWTQNLGPIHARLTEMYMNIQTCVHNDRDILCLIIYIGRCGNKHLPMGAGVARMSACSCFDSCWNSL